MSWRGFYFLWGNLLSSDSRDKDELRGVWFESHTCCQWPALAFVMDATLCSLPGSSLPPNVQLRWLLAFYSRMSKLRCGEGLVTWRWSWGLNLAWMILQGTVFFCVLYLLNSTWVTLGGAEMSSSQKIIGTFRGKLSFSVNFQFQGLWIKRKKT